MVICGNGSYYGTKKCTFKILKPAINPDASVDAANGFEDVIGVQTDTETGEVSNARTVVGSVADNGLSIDVSAGTLKKSAELSARPPSADEMAVMGMIDQGAERIISPVGIDLDGYDGNGFGYGEFTLTMPIEDDSDLGAYIFCTYDESTGEIRYLYPDDYDLTAGTMSVSLPHLSSWWGKKMTRQEQIEKFLNDYSTRNTHGGFPRNLILKFLIQRPGPS